MVVATVLGVPFRAASAIRRARVFHPDGAMFTGELVRLAPDDQGLPLHSCAVVARLSKGLGLPWGALDVVGLAFRLPATAGADTPWDVLLASAGIGSLGRMLPLPTTSWNDANFSSLMPLRFDGRMWWLRARLLTPHLRGMDLGAPTDALEAPGLMFAIDQAQGSGAFEPLATLRSTGALSDAAQSAGDGKFGFDPAVNSPASVRPQPEWLRDIRQSAYRNSRAGRRTAE
ncbi:MAG: phosphodiesterase [Rhodococcus sp. (in: high G+C Gram-positive bacteria)]